MSAINHICRYKLAALFATLLLITGDGYAQNWTHHSTSDNSTIVKRHETGAVVNEDKLYALGGRGNRPVQVFNATQNKWSTLAPLPMELHHFQPVILNGYLYAIGAFTCCYPNEPTIADIYRLNLASNTWETHGSIPNTRLRGSAGAVVHNDKIYLIGGNTDGHSGGAVAWLDEYNPENGEWRTLPDAPNARDHFNAAVVDNRLIATSGRQTNVSFGGMVAATDVYNFDSNTWTSVAPIPTPRAGAMLGVSNGNVIVIGGETDTQVQAHDQVEAFQVATGEWRSLPALIEGRHGGAGGVVGDTLHAITGNLNRGGGQEVTTHEVLNISDTDNDGLFDFEDSTNNSTIDSDGDGLTDQRESTLQTDPINQDSDGDGLTDGEEVNQYSTSPLSADTDNDGLSDIDEIQTHNTNPVLADSDSDSLNDSDELTRYFTDPLLSDSDNDGLSDSEEVLTHSTNPNAYDTDLDGQSDATEVADGTNPVNEDEDNDGILNTVEGNIDTDGDSIPNFMDLDSDNDGIPDIIENRRADNDSNGMLDASDSSPASDVLFDADQDGINNLLDLDSDQDGLTDLLEAAQSNTTATVTLSGNDFIDTNANGWHDNYEGLSVADTDADATPDFLDLDSDDDGVTDLRNSGINDADNNGKIDDVIDNNGDGLHDDLTTLQRVVPGNESGSASGSSSGSASGQSAMPPSQGGGGGAPFLPVVLAFFALVARQQRSKFRVSCRQSR